MTKTVLFISPTGTMDNGAEISIFYLMKLMVEKGNRVLNAFPDYHLPIQEEYKLKMQDAGVEVVGLSASKWWWEEAPGGLPGTHYQRIQAYQKNIQDLREVIRKQKVDLVISNTVNVFQGAIAAAYENTRHFWLIHEFPEGEFAYYREKLDFIDHFSDEIFAVTGALQSEISVLLPDRNVHDFISFNKVDKITLAQGNQHRIIQIGRITDNKNQLELIKSYELLHRPDVPLVFIGAEDEGYAKKCKDYVREHELTNIRFLGYKENPWSEVTDKDICVFTSKVETFGMVYIESLLNAVPTIVSDNKGYQSVRKIFEQGDMYPRGDYNALSGIIKETLSDFSLKKKEILESQSKIDGLYSLENSYRNILTCIGLNKEPAPKETKAYLEFLEVKMSLKDLIKQTLKSLLRLKKIQ